MNSPFKQSEDILLKTVVVPSVERGYLRLSGSNETEAEQADTDMPSPEVGGVPPKARPRTENYDEGKYVRTAHIGECLTTSYAEYSDEVIP